MKYEDLRKRTFLETGFITLAIALLSGLVYGLDTVDEDFIKGNQEVKNKADAIAAETNTLKSKYLNIQTNKTLYEEIKTKQQQGQLVITRQRLTDVYKQFKKDYFLASLKLSMPSIDEAKDAAMRRKTSVVNVSEVIVDLEAISDEHIYRLMQAMDRKLPGMVAINKMSLSRQQQVSKDTLSNITQKGPTPLVKGNIKFLWYGITPIDEGQKNVQGGAATRAPGAIPDGGSPPP